MSPSKRISSQRLLIRLAIIVLGTTPGGFLNAHEGPPFPILVDRPVDGSLVSVWADPDLGMGTFYIIIDPQDAQPAVVEPDVKLWVQPATRRLKKVTYVADRDNSQDRMQFAVYPQFDALEVWTIGVLITSPGKHPVELSTEVTVTPPGLGPWGLLIYSLPFLLIGGLWGVALLRHWKLKNTSRNTR